MGNNKWSEDDWNDSDKKNEEQARLYAEYLERDRKANSRLREYTAGRIMRWLLILSLLALIVYVLWRTL